MFAVMVPPRSPSEALGVVQAANMAVSIRLDLRPSALFACPPRGASEDFGVGQDASCAAVGRLNPPDLSLSAIAKSGPACAARGVGHPEQALADVGRAEARRAEISRPDGVRLAFQVRVNKVEPLQAVARRNLLAKDDVRSADADEMKGRWP